VVAGDVAGLVFVLVWRVVAVAGLHLEEAPEKFFKQFSALQ